MRAGARAGRWARLSWLGTLGAAAAIAGVVLAPQVLRLIAAVTGGGSAAAGIVAYEVGLWAPGVLVGWLGRRIGWLTGILPMTGVIMAPLGAELALLGLLGIPPRLGAMDLGIRIVVGTAAVAAGVRIGRKESTRENLAPGP